jgi:hypothetical protein
MHPATLKINTVPIRTEVTRLSGMKLETCPKLYLSI